MSSLTLKWDLGWVKEVLIYSVVMCRKSVSRDYCCMCELKGYPKNVTSKSHRGECFTAFNISYIMFSIGLVGPSRI